MSVQTQKLRAVIWPLLSPETGLLYVDRISWPKLEKASGQYDFAPIHAAIGRARSIKRYAILHIEPLAPMFCVNAVDEFILLLESIGREFGMEPAILGVDVCCPGGEHTAEHEVLVRIVSAYRNAFPKARLFVQADSQVEAIADEGIGLIVTPENIDSVKKTWSKIPLRMVVDPADTAAIAVAVKKHVSILESRTLEGSNAPTHTGHRFLLRSVTIDDADKGNGSVKISLSFANEGTLPCYLPADFMLRLSGSGVPDVREYLLPLNAADIGPGCEKKLEATLDTTGLVNGEYDVHVGLFMKGTGYSVPFGIEGRVSDGYYECRLIVIF